MRYPFPRLFAAFFVTIIMLCLFIGCLSSCTTTKEVNKHSLVKDSSVVKELQDSIRLLISEKAWLEQVLKENEYATVEFDSTRCPQIVFPEGAAMLNKDSIQRLVNDLNNSILGLNNRIRTYADGSREITGRLRSATYSKDKEIQQRLKLEREVDSLRQLKQKEKVVVNTVEKIKEVRKKTKFLNQWWLLPAGFIAGVCFCHRKKIVSVLRG